MRVLLIDDERFINQISAQMLVKEGVRAEDIVHAANGREALDYLRTCNTRNFPNLILLDINMPEMDGWEFIRVFAESDFRWKANTEVYVLSSSHSDSDLVRFSTHQHIRGYYNKPLTRQKVNQLLADARQD